MNKNLINTIVGAAVAAVSTAMIADYAVRKRSPEKTAYTAILVTGIAGLAAGTLLAGVAVKKSKKAKAPVIHDDLDDCEVLEIEQNISEVLGDEEASDIF